MLTRPLFQAALLCLLAACGAQETAPATTPEPVSCPPTEALLCPEPAAVQAVAAAEPIEAEVVRVVAGECDLASIPAALIEETTPEQSEAIVAAIRAWVNGAGAPWLLPREGILFAKSEDDLGADPPHPTWTREQGTRACGQQTLWLRDRLLAQLRVHGSPQYGNPIRCTGNVCCYSALGEYDSGGGIVMSQQGDGWRLRAGYEVAINGTIGDENGDGLRERVKRRLRGLLRGRCPGEPATVP